VTKVSPPTPAWATYEAAVARVKAVKGYGPEFRAAIAAHDAAELGLARSNWLEAGELLDAEICSSVDAVKLVLERRPLRSGTIERVLRAVRTALLPVEASSGATL